MATLAKPLIAAATLTTAVGLAFGSGAHAHNQGWIILPNGECVVVAAGNVVVAPDGTFRMDLIPETADHQEFGASYAASQGNSRLEKGTPPPGCVS
jgi:hypothetical protein